MVISLHHSLWWNVRICTIMWTCQVPTNMREGCCWTVITKTQKYHYLVLICVRTWPNGWKRGMIRAPYIYRQKKETLEGGGTETHDDASPYGDKDSEEWLNMDPTCNMWTKKYLNQILVRTTSLIQCFNLCLHSLMLMNVHFHMIISTEIT